MNITFRSAIILGFIALICTGLSIAVYQLTHAQITSQIAIQQQKLLQEVIPHDRYDNDLLKSCYLPNKQKFPLVKQLYLAKKANKITAYIMLAIAQNGYNGNITLLIATTPQGKVLGVRTVEQNETPGLGDKIELSVSNWIKSFTGKMVDPKDLTMWAVKKDGGAFDQFSGATITPRAVVNGVKTAVLSVLNDFKQINIEQLPHCQ